MATSRLPRHLKIGLIVLTIGSAIAFGLFVNVIGRIQSMMQEKEPETSNPFTPAVTMLYERTDPPMTVKLFFPGEKEDVVLSGEDQTIFRSAGLTNRARQILQKLLDGPKSPNSYPSMPKDTKLQEVFVDDMGIAYVDFSSTISANHPGGMLTEQATVYSIVNSLIYNLPEIRQVKILVGGAEKETLAGHFLLLPLAMDLSITDVAPKEQGNNAD
ncbi:MAG TPA: GerMN domain-containing protein [Terriglobia bacterium]|nr:GerMN domain-containing protein [Terriglobia bacterium]